MSPTAAAPVREPMTTLDHLALLYSTVNDDPDLALDHLADDLTEILAHGHEASGAARDRIRNLRNGLRNVLDEEPF